MTALTALTGALHRLQILAPRAGAALRRIWTRPLLSSDPVWAVDVDREGGAVLVRRRRRGVWSATSQPPRAAAAVMLVPPPEMISRCEVVAPACSDAKLRRAVGLALPVYTPIARERAAIAVARRERRIAEIAVADRAVIAKLTASDAPWRTALGLKQARVAAVVADLDAAEAFAPLEARPAPCRRPAIWVAWAAGSMAAIGMIGLLTAPLLSTLADRAKISAEIAALAPIAVETRVLLAEQRRLETALEPIVGANGADRRSMLAAMAKVAAALPGDVVLDQIFLDRERARVVGVATSATGVLDRFALAPGFQDIRANAPSLSAADGRERFDVALVAGSSFGDLLFDADHNTAERP